MDQEKHGQPAGSGPGQKRRGRGSARPRQADKWSQQCSAKRKNGMTSSGRAGKKEARGGPKTWGARARHTTSQLRERESTHQEERQQSGAMNAGNFPKACESTTSAAM